MEDAGRNKSAFLFYTDAHWTYGSKMAPTLLKYLHRKTPINHTIYGGDIVDAEPTSDTLGDSSIMAYLWNWREQLRDLPNHHSVVGNHDDGNATNNIFDTKYVYAYLMAAEETPDIVRGGDMYYYIDRPNEMTRYLYLDTAYKGLDTAQTEFISNALKTTPENWHIVVAAHIWYQPDYSQINTRPIPIAGYGSGIQNLCSALDNYNTRAGEFSECTGWVEFCIGGHVHRDYDGATPGGIPIILCETDSRHFRGAYTYTAGTVSEAAVSGIVADYDAGKVSVVRVGRGESRVVTLPDHPKPVTYTNQLPIATGADGEIYNGVGYKADTRWSSSSDEETSRAGTWISGYIPLVRNNVVYLKNIDAKQNNTTVGTVVFTFDTKDADISAYNMTNLTTHNGAVFDADGNLIQFTCPQNDAIKYFRLQCAGFTDESIITVNEPIE